MVVAATAVSACAASGDGGSSNPGLSSAASATPQSLLRESLEGKQRITSGVLSLRATVTLHGSTTSSAPITVSFSGPFQSLGSGHRIESDFTLTAAAAGQRLSLGLLTTGSAGYLRLNGSWFRLPAKQFSQLRTSLAASGQGSLPGLSVSPLTWLRDPQRLGNATVDGVPTTEVQARVAVGALADQLGALLTREAANPALHSAGLPAKLSGAERRQLVAELHSPTVELFIGNADHLLRRAVLGLTVKVPAAAAAKLPGISSLGVGVTANYAQLNRPQTITAPKSVKPYSQLGQQLSGLANQLGGSVTRSGGSGAAGRQGAYEECLQKSGGNVTKLQKCASLIDSVGQ